MTAIKETKKEKEKNYALDLNFVDMERTADQRIMFLPGEVSSNGNSNTNKVTSIPESIPINKENKNGIEKKKEVKEINEKAERILKISSIKLQQNISKIDNTKKKMENERRNIFLPLLDKNQIRICSSNFISKIKLPKDENSKLINEETIHILWKEISRSLAEKLGCENVEPTESAFYDSIIKGEEIEILKTTPLENLLKNFLICYPSKFEVYASICKIEKALCSFTGSIIKKDESIYTIKFEEDNERNYEKKPLDLMTKGEREREYVRQIAFRNEFLIKKFSDSNGNNSDKDNDQNQNNSGEDIYKNIICNILYSIDPTPVINFFINIILKEDHSNLKEFIEKISSNRKIIKIFTNLIKLIIIFKKTVIDCIPLERYEKEK